MLPFVCLPLSYIVNQLYNSAIHKLFIHIEFNMKLLLSILINGSLYLGLDIVLPIQSLDYIIKSGQLIPAKKCSLRVKRNKPHLIFFSFDI